MVPILAGHKLKPILPPKKHQPDDGCIRPHPDLYCFLAGSPPRLPAVRYYDDDARALLHIFES